MKSWMNRTGGRIAMVVLTVVFSLIFIVNVLLPPALVLAGRVLLPRVLNTPRASVRDLDWSLLRGVVSIQGVRVDQPEGFDPGPLLTLSKARVNVKMSALLRGRLVIDHVQVDRLSLHVIRDAEGRLNLTALMPSPAQAAPAPGAAPTPRSPSEAPARAPAAPPPAVTLSRARVEHLKLAYTDHALGKTPLQVDIVNVNVALDDLMVDPDREGDLVMPGRLMMTAEVPQGELPVGRLGVSARIGIVGTNIPPVNAVVRLCGLELKTFEPAVPPGVATALGGESLDVSADAAVASDVLDVQATLASWGGKLSTGLGGTPAKPRLEGGGTLLGLAGFAGGRLGGKLLDVGQVGTETAEAATRTAAALGKGVGKTAGALGQGLFKTVKKAAQADLSGAIESVKDTAEGTVSEAAQTATEAGQTAAEGVSQAASSVTADDRAQTWRAGVGERWQEQWKEALVALDKRPYPQPRQPDPADAPVVP